MKCCWDLGTADRIHGEGMHDVSEVFSVPRMVKCASKKGMFPGMSYDLVLGDNLLKTDQRKRSSRNLEETNPFASWCHHHVRSSLDVGGRVTLNWTERKC